MVVAAAPVGIRRALRVPTESDNAMIFYVRRVLSSGLVRFGAGQRAESVPASTGDPFSTGPQGEYRRRGEGGLYFAEERGVNAPVEVSSESEIRRLSSLSLVAKVVIGFGGLFLQNAPFWASCPAPASRAWNQRVGAEPFTFGRLAARIRSLLGRRQDRT